jgi:hypothetical protein
MTNFSNLLRVYATLVADNGIDMTVPKTSSQLRRYPHCRIFWLIPVLAIEMLPHISQLVLNNTSGQARNQPTDSGGARPLSEGHPGRQII